MTILLRIAPLLLRQNQKSHFWVIAEGENRVTYRHTTTTGLIVVNKRIWTGCPTVAVALSLVIEVIRQMASLGKVH